MNRHLAPFLVSALILVTPALRAAESVTPPADANAMPASCPMHAEHMAAKAAATTAAETAPRTTDHLAAVSARGDQGMGFSQAATTHHFLLETDGGEIRVEANSASDTTSRDQIRRHLVEIARSFTAGDFSTPMFVHGQVPPGVPALEHLGSVVTYQYADTDNGGRVSIKTTNAEALQAIQAFLRFQIEEHQTGDPLQPAS